MGRVRIAPYWAAPVTLSLSVLGLLFSAYLTYAHYTTAANLACSDKGFVNCAQVTTSAESHFLGMPVAVLGLAYYVGMVVLCTPWAWRLRAPWVTWLRLAGVIVGVIMITHLIYAELVVLAHICLYCTGVHIATFLLFVAVVFAFALSVPEDQAAPRSAG